MIVLTSLRQKEETQSTSNAGCRFMYHGAGYSKFQVSYQRKDTSLTYLCVENSWYLVMPAKTSNKKTGHRGTLGDADDYMSGCGSPNTTPHGVSTFFCRLNIPVVPLKIKSI